MLKKNPRGSSNVIVLEKSDIEEVYITNKGLVSIFLKNDMAIHVWLSTGSLGRIGQDHKRDNAPNLFKRIKAYFNI